MSKGRFIKDNDGGLYNIDSISIVSEQGEITYNNGTKEQSGFKSISQLFYAAAEQGLKESFVVVTEIARNNRKGVPFAVHKGSILSATPTPDYVSNTKIATSSGRVLHVKQKTTDLKLDVYSYDELSVNSAVS